MDTFNMLRNFSCPLPYFLYHMIIIEFFYKMVDSWKLRGTKLHIFSTISFLVIIFVVLFADSVISNFSLQLVAYRSKSSASQKLQTHKITLEPLLSVQEAVIVKEDSEDHANLVPARNFTTRERIAWFKKKLPEFEIFNSSRLAQQFDDRVREFLDDQCKVRFFYTWISPAGKFGKREFFAMESIFKAHPNGCLVIVSRTMDSLRGQEILKPLVDQGYRVLAVTPDLTFLLNNTPGEAWFSDIKRGNKDPGRIPFAQNLSNLIRLALLYKYGGVYLDTDFIVLKDFSGLRNSIGAQSADMEGKWRRLNNAVLVFDKNHSLLYKFIEEFAFTFDGNRWGHNGPYMVSRVVEREAPTHEYNFTVLPTIAFYPVDWIQIAGFFTKPNDTAQSKRVKAKLIQLHRDSYGVHLWNRESKKLNIEEGSIIDRLISDHCVICKHIYNS